MKLKCDDGIVRSFRVAEFNGRSLHRFDSICLECHYSFGVSDTGILKSRWKRHVCKETDLAEMEQKRARIVSFMRERAF